MERRVSKNYYNQLLITWLSTKKLAKGLIDWTCTNFISGPAEPMPAYHTLLWEAWIPVVRLAVQRWQSRQSVPDPLIGNRISVSSSEMAESILSLV